jgi:flavin-dependent dehydrogenase
MGAAAVAPRIELDAALCALARSNGAEILQGATCVGLKQRGDGVIVELQDGQFVRGDFIIAADGARSIVQRSIPQRDAELSLLPFRDFQHRSDHKRDTSSLASEWYAYRGYVTEISSYAATHMCVWFDESLLPGYGWSFPMVGGVANIGCCVRRRAGDPGYLLADAWRATLAHPFLATLTTNAASHVERVRAWPIPSRIGTARLSAWEGRVLFVGDAARAADPMSGEGVGQALETGIAAAHAIAAYHPSNHAVVARVYEHYLSRTLGRDHVMAQLLSNVLSHPLGARAAVRVSGISERSARLVGRWLFEDFPRSIVISPSQWHHRSKIPLATRARVNP